MVRLADTQAGCNTCTTHTHFAGLLSLESFVLVGCFARLIQLSQEEFYYEPCGLRPTKSSFIETLQHMLLLCCNYLRFCTPEVKITRNPLLVSPHARGKLPSRAVTRARNTPMFFSVCGSLAQGKLPFGVGTWDESGRAGIFYSPARGLKTAKYFQCARPP